MEKNRDPCSPAVKRLHRDLSELEKEKESLTTIRALPTSDIFVWHCNLRPDYGPLAGVTFHLKLKFPTDYPHSPPKIELCSFLEHPNVFEDFIYPGRSWICLDMIQDHHTGDPYTGWTSAYTVTSLLLQLQSFLFAENVPQDWGGDARASQSSRSIDKALRSAREFRVQLQAFDGSHVTHTHAKPWPPLPAYKGEMSEQVRRSKPQQNRIRVPTHGYIGALLRPPPTPAPKPEPKSKEEMRPKEFMYSESDFPPLVDSTAGKDESHDDKVYVADAEKSSISLSPQEITQTLTSITSTSSSEASTSDEVTQTPTLLLLPSSSVVSVSNDVVISLTSSKDEVCSIATASPQDTKEVILGSNSVLAALPSLPILSKPSTSMAQRVSSLPSIPSTVYAQIFSLLSPKEILRARDVCAQWKKVIISYNLFERTQIMCFHSKVPFDDPNAILGVGLKVEFYPFNRKTGQTALKSASSPLDVLSFKIFDEEGVRRGVWGKDWFGHFLPLLLDATHGAKAAPLIEETIYDVMKACRYPTIVYDSWHSSKESFQLKPYKIFELLATLMNTMVVELMNSAHGLEIHRYASEKALEGYCNFHHMLLYFAKKYPIILHPASQQVGLFIVSEKYRHKKYTPNVGLLLVCLTLSNKGWDALRKHLVMEVFDRQVLWLLRKHPQLAHPNAEGRLDLSFHGAKTSLRLLMFQVTFMSLIGRPKGAAGPFDVLERYERQFGKPTTAQKEELQQNAKEILTVTTWHQFFQRLGGPVPPARRIYEILRTAVVNSERKKYHDKENIKP